MVFLPKWPPFSSVSIQSGFRLWCSARCVCIFAVICYKQSDVSNKSHHYSRLYTGLDYGALLSLPADPVSIIRPVLKSGNVHVFSKLSSKIPIQGGGTLSSSAVCNAWSQKLFIEGATANSKVPESVVRLYWNCVCFLSSAVLRQKNLWKVVRHLETLSGFCLQCGLLGV